MKISSKTLKTIAVSAGISATVVGLGSAADIAAAENGQPRPTVCPLPPIQEKRVVVRPKHKTIRDFFTEADINKDGKLSAKEFNKAYMAIIAQEKAKAAQAKQPILPHDSNGCPGCGLG
ncbi:MAG: EF-hand domain-containing protein [Akkermansiaceae bacterium]|nr:EF-hand domain-containing protein [Akkermansiaceae bacterium]|tara:strand:- start:673 stop:1029 length:357 start_codon:yes stop_codon:yes gene_type:complete